MEEKRAVRTASDTELFEQYKKTKDTAVRNEIIDRYTYLAEIMAKRFSGRGIDYDDLYRPFVCSGAVRRVKGAEVYNLCDADDNGRD